MSEAELTAGKSSKPNINANGAALNAGAPPDIDSDDLKHINDQKESYLVLKETMLFWHEKGGKLYEEIEKFLEDDAVRFNRNNANLLATAAKALADAKTKAVDAASKLIPFQCHKLNSVEVNSKTEHSFVVVAPSVCKDSNGWLEQCAKEQVVRTIVNPPTLELAAATVNNEDQ